MILGMLPYISANFELVTENVAFHFPQFQISCDSIGLKTTVCDITFLEQQVRHQDQINSRSEDEG